MENDFILIKAFLNKRAEIKARINHLIYNGRPEVKEIKNKKYIYIRRVEDKKKIAEYVDAYSDELFALIQEQWKERKTLDKELKNLDKTLVKLGYSPRELSSQIARNLEFAKVNLKYSIYDQAILEGIDTNLPDTETILENGLVSGMRVSDIQKILNLKHAWEFILDENVIQAKTDYNILCNIAGLVNDKLISQGGYIRNVPVRISGSSYLPPMPNESKVIENIQTILSSSKKDIDKSIDLCLYCMKTQIFKDGNKRTSIIFANHYLISKGEGLLIIPANDVMTFKKLLRNYYEDKDLTSVKSFMKEKCWHHFEEKKIAVAEKLNITTKIQAGNNAIKNSDAGSINKSSFQKSNQNLLNTEAKKEIKKFNIEELNPKNNSDNINNYLKNKKQALVDKKEKEKNNKKQIEKSK